MNVDFSKLIEIYGTRGLVFGLVILFVSSLLKSKLIGDFLSKLGDRIIEWFLKKKTNDIETNILHQSDISNHDIFNYIDLWTYSKVPTFKFSSEYRTIVFRKYLTIYLKSYKNGMSDYIKSEEYKKMDQAELWKSFLSMINKIVMNYENDSLNAGIPSIVIDKMKEKNRDTIQLTIDLIGNISNSQFYESKDNLLKVYSILNIVLSVLESTISNSESVCNSINGQLRGSKIIENGKEIIEP